MADIEDMRWDPVSPKTILEMDQEAQLIFVRHLAESKGYRFVDSEDGRRFEVYRPDGTLAMCVTKEDHG